jgi:hypothetical protein
MGKCLPIQPWDDGAMTRDLVELARGLDRVRLDLIDIEPGVPGAYLQFTAKGSALPVLGTVAYGRYVAYVGLAWCLRERLGRYRGSLRGLKDFGERDIFVAIVPCASRASAAYAERALIDAYNPVFNGLGYGSRAVGAKRKGQRSSSFDALFKRRDQACEPSMNQQACAHLRVVSHLARMDPGGPRWSAIPHSATLAAPNSSSPPGGSRQLMVVQGGKSRRVSRTR